MKKIFLSLVFAWVSIFGFGKSLFTFNKITNNWEYVDSIKWMVTTLPNIGDAKPGSPIYYGLTQGYLSDELYLYLDDDCKYFFIFKSFSDKPYYVICLKNNANTLNVDSVNLALKKYDYNEAFVHYGGLKNALKGKIRKSFLEEVVSKKAINNKLIDEFNGYEYTFTNGYLTSYKPLDGLSEEAREFKNHSLFPVIKANAERKHHSKEDIYKEINFQFHCIYQMTSTQVRLAYNDKFNYNIALVYFILHKNVTLEDFTFYVPEAKTEEITDNSVILSYKSMLFIFQNNRLEKVL